MSLKGKAAIFERFDSKESFTPSCESRGTSTFGQDLEGGKYFEPFEGFAVTSTPLASRTRKLEEPASGFMGLQHRCAKPGNTGLHRF